MKLSNYQESVKKSVAICSKSARKNDEYYLQKLDNIFNKTEKFSFNFAAACFGSLWYIYRKMYGLAAIIAIIKTILIVISLVINWQIQKMPFVEIAVIEFAVSAFVGFTGNLSYYKFINKNQKKIKPDYYSAVLKKWKLLIFLFVATVIYTVMISFGAKYIIDILGLVRQFILAILMRSQSVKTP
jgi:hypothetical protein